MENVPCAVPNNDLRYELNKLRARRFCQARGVQLLWCPAKDKVGVEALRSDPSLPGKKKQWLQRHDRQCGDLHGMLPLAAGMPMILMEHVDKSDEIRMLKGTKVKLHSVDLHPDDDRESRGKSEYVLQHLPNCVFVVKEHATWCIDPSTTPGLYPLKAATATWFLDKGRPHPKLNIHRKQLALAPGFALPTICPRRKRIKRGPDFMAVTGEQGGPREDSES